MFLSLDFSKTLSCMPSFIKICFKVCLNLFVCKRLDGERGSNERENIEGPWFLAGDPKIHPIENPIQVINYFQILDVSVYDQISWIDCANTS